MLREEFQNRLEQVDEPGFTEYSDEDWGTIDFVYTWHPAVDTKDDIVLLFSKFGLTVIYDMLPRAQKVMRQENKLIEMRQALAFEEEGLRNLSIR